ncbi:uncharacterized protein LOC128962985 [Oppia nitens]|uniref:uncharacterized protein LOC128962985 n=1 Tax=Oppia nitens TaxID=1686743 RepID=UPI0023DB0D50|nr:uncharacterized protein LOC128962985 [Oppia nitens]
MTTFPGRERPYKIWSSNREIRKSVVAQSLVELKVRAADKLGYDNVTDLRVVLESDGTEVEDETYFQTAEKDTIFLLLKAEERWLPPGVEALKAAINAIPKIVCDALRTLELVNVPPTWSIRDDKGNVTVVLNWDQKERFRKGTDYAEPTSWRVEIHPTQPSDAQSYPTTSIPFSSTASTSRAKVSLDGLQQRPITKTLPFRTLSTDEEEDDFERIEQLSPTHDLDHDHSLCDFHCAALHRGGGHISVTRSAATSPVQEGISIPILGAGLSSSAESIEAMRATGAIPKKSSTVKGHVRFMDTEPTRIEISNNNNSESESETTEREDEQVCERYLLLVDQLSMEHKKHLNIKDIGVILERLSSKIIDIDKLEREKESQDTHNWVIKATIRGEVLREVGIIYNGHYYCIAEHPGYF